MVLLGFPDNMGLMCTSLGLGAAKVLGSGLVGVAKPVSGANIPELPLSAQRVHCRPFHCPLDLL